MSERPIGVFDSGVGGLTVVKEIMDLMPEENIVYYADNLHHPYGPKSIEEVYSFAEKITQYLVAERGCKIIVIACNTATAVGLEKLRNKITIPVLGSIEAGVLDAVKKTVNGRIGLIATERTVKSNVYQDMIHKINNSFHVYAVAAPSLVTLVEKGDLGSLQIKQQAEDYLSNLLENNIDTLIIGCTHFTYIKDILQRIVGEDVTLISSDQEMAKSIKQVLVHNSELNTQEDKGNIEFLTSNASKLTEKYINEGSKILGWEQPNFKQCNLFEQRQNTIVLGVIGADVHAVGNRILHYAFEEAGFKVINIGVMASQREFIEAAIETDADAILVSSLYGHGEMDCQGFRDRCMEAGIGDILLYVGGNLVVGKQDWQVVQSKFINMGFDRVYPPGIVLEEAIRQLKDDIEKKVGSKNNGGDCNTI